MSYIGNTATQQAFTPAVDFFNGNGSTTAFTLSRPVASVAQVQAVISNVPQKPGDAFTVSGNTITFTSAPPSGTQNIYVYYTSPITQVIAPGQNTVGTTQIQDNAITTAKIAAGAVVPADLSTGAPNWDSGYNFGIGVTPDAVTFPFAGGSLQLPNGVSMYSWGASGMYLQYNAYYNSGWKYKTTGNPLAQVFFGGNGGFYLNGAVSGTAGAAATLVQTLGVENGKTLVLQGSTQSSGTGIAFPATQSASSDANTLDDYEEGTWTPTDISGAGLTFTGNNGYYTKIGRVVVANINLVFPTTASGTTIQISLPFNARTGLDTGQGGFFCFANTGRNDTIFVYQGTIYFYNASGAAQVYSTYSGKSVEFAITYITAT